MRFRARIIGIGRKEFGMVIYLDVLLAINGIVDYILLRAAAKLTGHPRNRLRILLGATLGAVYAATVC